MLPLQHRLRHDRDIKTLFAAGKSVFDACCGLKFRKNGQPESRFAVVVGSKVSKNAVARNRIRRRYREIVQKHLASLAPGYDVMLLVRPEALGKKAGELEARLLKVLKRTPLWAGT